MLADNAIEYELSSARIYLCGEHGKYPVLNLKELDDINLSFLIAARSASQYTAHGRKSPWKL